MAKKKVNPLSNAQLNILKDKIKKDVRDKNLKEKGFSKSNNCNYVQGVFWSKKNKKEYIFRSTYEFGYFHILEEDKNVVSYIVEPFKIPYRLKGEIRNYIPDIMILYLDGSVKLVEIKPVRHLTNRVVKVKASAAREFVKKNIPNGEFQFITEKDIFNSSADYRRLVALIK